MSTAVERARQKVAIKAQYDKEIIDANNLKSVTDRARAKVAAKKIYDDAMVKVNTIGAQKHLGAIPTPIPAECKPKPGDTLVIIEGEGKLIDAAILNIGKPSAKTADILKNENNDLYKRAVKLLIQELSKAKPEDIKALKPTHDAIIQAMRNDKDLGDDLLGCLKTYLYNHYDISKGGNSQKGFFEELLGFSF